MRTSFAFAVVCGLALGAVTIALLAQGPAAAEKKGERASGDADINAAKAVKPDIAKELERYGVT
jgi:hypothetical protein